MVPASVLRFIACGSVDDGKSTLIGRLLWDTRQVLEDHAAGLAADSRRHGTQGKALDYALLLDGLAAEREQGITIDVAYRHFSTARRRFIVADCPGHEQYTRNMATGASSADAAVLLVDARKGLLAQTRRHAHICALMGVRQVVLAVNKMDLVRFDAAVFTRIADMFASFAKPLALESLVAIPLSALGGDNVVEKSRRMSWYRGPTLLAALEGLAERRGEVERFTFPVQWVNRGQAGYRSYAGTACAGAIRKGETLRVTSSGKTARLRRIVTMDGDRTQAGAGAAISLVLDRELDVSRGDVLTRTDAPVDTTDQFEATLVWMDDDPGLVGRTYDLKLATQWAGASITAIKYRLNVDTMAHEASATLQLNDICICNLAMSQPVAFDSFARSRTLGGFILVDRLSRATVAAGMITHTLRRAQNVHRQALAVTAADRNRMNRHAGHVIWFTGLPGSGKSTLASALEAALHAEGVRTYVLDGDNLRQGLNRDLGFTDADRVENIRRAAEVAKLMQDAGLVVITSFISPFARERETARELIGRERFMEVHVSTPLKTCEARDPKGLYRRARAGEIRDFTGVSAPYEPPERAELTVNTASLTIEQSVQRIVDHVQQHFATTLALASP